MEESPEKVYAKYRGLIRSLINSIVVNNPAVVDAQDLQQVGAMALLCAMQSYEPSLGSFSSYIRKCIRNALLEQANSFNSAVTVDEKVRRQANQIRRLRTEGLSDEVIMTRLGIKKRSTYDSLCGLVDNHSVDLDAIELTASASGVDEVEIHRMLDEIGLTDREMEFIRLVTNGKTRDEMIASMSISRTVYYTTQRSIQDKILAWGQEE